MELGTVGTGGWLRGVDAGGCWDVAVRVAGGKRDPGWIRRPGFPYREAGDCRSVAIR